MVLIGIACARPLTECTLVCIITEAACQMTTEKDKSIQDLLRLIDPGKHNWIVVDYWDGDLCAIGIAHKDQPRRLIYISTFNQAPGYYYYECEEPAGPMLSDYTATKSAEGIDFHELMRIINWHFSTH